MLWRKGAKRNQRCPPPCKGKIEFPRGIAWTASAPIPLRMKYGILAALAITAFLTPAPAADVSSLEPEEIRDFDSNPEPVRKLLLAALDLTKRDLGYQYSSADPSRGGMDCSGTIYYLLNRAGRRPMCPARRTSSMPGARRKRPSTPVKSPSITGDRVRRAFVPATCFSGPARMQIQRKAPVTHVMIYLGKAKQDGRRLMVGASDGRTYRGEKKYGVSVFDFRMPAAESPSRFIGYARVPGLGE